MMKPNQALSVPRNAELVAQLQHDIKEELYKAVKIPRLFFLRHTLDPLINLPTRRFAELFAQLDSVVKNYGIVAAAQYAITQFTHAVISNGEEKIPKKGPLIVASNHPGTYDSLAIVSGIPREDVKLIVSGVPFLRNLPNARDHLIYATVDTMDRMDVIRKSIRHLEQGGALLFFPSGKIDPDPSVLPGAGDSLRCWSKSIEVFIKKVPDVCVVPTITSGVLLKDFINHPLTRFFPNGHERRRVMEFTQVIQQMMRKKPVNINPKVSFAQPIRAGELTVESGNPLNSLILNKTQQLLENHIEQYYADGRK